MIISDYIQVYLKTTETCNLNCDHCFTNGRNGAKIFFDPTKSISFLTNLFSKVKGGRILFHGGEPMLAPLKDMQKVIDHFSDNKRIEFGLQTNLVYKLTDERRAFINKNFPNFGTSWDHNIRFENFQQQLLWEQNVRSLINDGHYITVMVSLSRTLLETYSAKDLCYYFADLGIQHVLFERITSNGNAVLNPEIQPENKALDAWLLQMYEDTIQYELYNVIHNMFLDEIATSYVEREHVANRCRNCEQSLFTINADGTIAGCPNSAPTEAWGNINLSIEDNLKSSRRLKTMCCEMTRNPNCLKCPVSMICNGDCHRLPWQDDVCAAPKSLMIKMKQENKIEDYRKLLW